MRTKRRGLGGFIVVAALLVLMISAVTVAMIVFLTPQKDNPLSASETGIGFTSLVGGEHGWLAGGTRANLLAIAITRGKEADSAPYTEKLAILNLNAEDSKADVTLLRDPITGDLGFPIKTAASLRIFSGTCAGC